MKQIVNFSSAFLAAGLLFCACLSATGGPIHEAAASGDLDKVRELVWADPAQVSAVDTDGKTALHHAAAKGNLEMVKFLVANKADVTLRSRTRTTPISIARGYGHTEVEAFLMKQLAASGPVPNARVSNTNRFGRPIPPALLQRPSLENAPVPEAPVSSAATSNSISRIDDANSPAAILPDIKPEDLSLLHRVVQGGKVGFIDGTGKLVIPATLPESTGDSLLGQFSEGLIPVHHPMPVLKGFGWGYINEKGQTKISLGMRYIGADSFHEGLATVQNTDDKFGYIDKQGKEVIQPQFGLAYRFNEGYAAVEKPTGGWSFIDKSGKLAFTGYSTLEGFSEGLAAVCLATDTSIVKKRGYINHAGQLVIPCSYTLAEPCSEGIVIVSDRGTWFGLDTNGAVRISGSFQQLRSFSEGLAEAKVDEMWGFIDKSGKFVIPPKYEKCWRFSEGLAAVKINGKWGFIDKSGKLVIEAKFTLSESWEKSKGRIPRFRGGLAKMPDGTKSGYIDRSGKWIWEPTE